MYLFELSPKSMSYQCWKRGFGKDEVVNSCNLQRNIVVFLWSSMLQQVELAACCRNFQLATTTFWAGFPQGIKWDMDKTRMLWAGGRVGGWADGRIDEGIKSGWGNKMLIQGLNVHKGIKHSLEDRYIWMHDKSIQTWKRSYLLVFFAHNPYKTDR